LVKTLNKGCEEMSIFIVDRFVVKPEKQAEFISFIQRALEYMEEKPEKFREMKSWKLLNLRCAFSFLLRLLGLIC